MTRVKICGVTRPDDARAAAELGAWAVGMILSPRGPRALDRTRAEAVRRAIPAGVLAVGVFVDEGVEHMNELARSLALDIVQLHGSEPADVLPGLERPAIKAFTVASLDVAPWSAAFGALVEGPERGRPFDWHLVEKLAAPSGRLLLAGGLTSENVAAAIAAVRPFAVDVSSGVESAPGEKDHARLARFFEEARVS